jgi:uncharacterized membrane protein YqjE
MALSGSFVWLAISSVLARLVVYAVCVVVLIKAQHQLTYTPNIVKRAVPLIALAVCIWSISQSATNAWLFLVGELVIGAALYWLFTKNAKD